MKILAIGDLHGRKPIIKHKDFDAIISIGDIASDRDLSKYTRQWMKYIKSNPKIGIEQFLINKLGKRKLAQLEKKSLIEGNKILRYLDGFGKPIFFVAGNWDQSYGKSRIKDIEKSDYHYLKAFYDFWLGDKINPKLIKGVKNIRNCMYRLHEFQGLNIIGYGLSSAPEKKPVSRKWDLSNLEKISLDVSYKRIIEKLDNAYSKRDKKLPTILLSHNIPYDTKLDTITNKESYAYKKHLGSTVARQFCTRYQPLLCFGGHIHDHHGKDKIKKTTVVNVGYGKNAGALVEIKNNKIKKITFNSQ
jgi:Icc-related predicted phosphoesterase